MLATAEPLVFRCAADWLVGVLHRPAQLPARTGVIVVVGGPQYRVGSHRQFVRLGRELATAGYPVLRFDYRGMGDSTGEYRGFEHVHEDLRAAVDALTTALPCVDRVVLWGLCDGASAALMYARRDARVSGIVMANPWARTAPGEARAYVKAYYGRRLLQRAFWSKFLRGGVDVRGSLREFAGRLRLARGAATSAEHATFVDRMREGLAGFDRPVLSLESGRDLTMAEFAQLSSADSRWAAALRRPNVQRVRLPDADHTFSGAGAMEEVGRRCVAWLGAIAGNAEAPAAQRRAACR